MYRHRPRACELQTSCRSNSAYTKASRTDPFCLTVLLGIVWRMRFRTWRWGQLSRHPWGRRLWSLVYDRSMRDW
jgi:hypothetical protein